jgi:hypothetical protein
MIQEKNGLLTEKNGYQQKMGFKLKPETATKKPSQLSISRDLPAQLGTRALTTVAGAPGDLFKTINDIAAGPLTKAITGSSVPYEQTGVGKVLRTSEELQSRLESHFPSLKPKSKLEKGAGDVLQNTIDLLLPQRYLKMGKYALSPQRALGISGIANLGKEVTELWTGSKEKGENVKSGLLIAGALFNPQTAKKISNELYDKANQLLQPGSLMNTTNLNRNLDALERKVLNGRNYSQLADSEKFVIDEINKVMQSSASGTAPVETITSIKRSLNENLNKQIYKARTKHMAKQINGDLRKSMEEYGRINPEWWEYQKAADQASGAIAQSNYISRGLEKALKGRTHGLEYIFGIGAPAGFSLLSPIGAAAGATAYHAAKIGHRMIKSPELLKHYLKVAGAAASGNQKAVHKELDEFEKELKKKKVAKYRLKD